MVGCRATTMRTLRALQLISGLAGSCCSRECHDRETPPSTTALPMHKVERKYIFSPSPPGHADDGARWTPRRLEFNQVRFGCHRFSETAKGKEPHLSHPPQRPKSRSRQAGGRGATGSDTSSPNAGGGCNGMRGIDARVGCVLPHPMECQRPFGCVCVCECVLVHGGRQARAHNP